MNCRHHYKRPCPICSNDGYAPSKKYGEDLKKAVEGKGALYWHEMALWWMNKFTELQDAQTEADHTLKGMHEMSPKKRNR